MTTTAHPLEFRLNYSPHHPTPRQHAALLLDDLGVLEAFYGGAGGGGKSDWLLQSALRFVHVPGYAALLLRKTFKELELPSAIMDRAKEWLIGADGVRWNDGKFRFYFDSGATLSFGHLQHSGARHDYSGAEFQFIGFDELTSFTEEEYRFLFSRLRKPSGLDDDAPLANVPLRMRSASNPGNRGHEWVKRRLVKRDTDPDDPKDTPARARARIFIPARLKDNPHVDQASYEESLAHVDPLLRGQILDGDWDSRPPGDYVYTGRGIDAAVELGQRLDRALRDGTIPPPVGGTLALGIDWGEHTHAVLGWPLERGGLYVPASVELEGVEPGQSAARIFSLVANTVRRAQDTDPPDLDPYLNPVQAISEHRYDAAGAQSMRTYMAKVRAEHKRAKSVAVPFGAPAKSGAAGNRRSFKAEAMNYLRRLFRRTAAEVFYEGDVSAYIAAEERRPSWDDERFELEVRFLQGAGLIALSPRAGTLIRQARGLLFADVDLGLVAKGDDHGPDALVALTAPIARRHRA